MGFCRSMSRRLRAALTLLPSDRWTLVQAWFLLLGTDLGLRLLSFRRLQGVLLWGQKDAGDRPQSEMPATIRRLGWFVDVAARNHLYPMGCLRRSLALQWLLGRRGVTADLRIGVQRQGGGLSAHAWLEHDGQFVGYDGGMALDYACLSGPRVRR